jgi:hypothetical protein
MNVEIGDEAAQFPEKEYINGIAVAVYDEHVPNLRRIRPSISEKKGRTNIFSGDLFKKTFMMQMFS